MPCTFGAAALPRQLCFCGADGAELPCASLCGLDGVTRWTIDTWYFGGAMLSRNYAAFWWRLVPALLRAAGPLSPEIEVLDLGDRKVHSGFE